MVISKDLSLKWLHWLDSCPSTNSWALGQLSTLNHGDAVFTKHQTAGRGQQGRVWHSLEGGLTASFILHGIAIAQLPQLSLIVGLAIIYALEDLVPDLQQTLRLKWANDVMLEGKKLAGILCESVSDKYNYSSVVIGVGLNRRAKLDNLPNATSLHYWSKTVPSELEILERSRHYLLEAVSLLNFYAASEMQFLPLLSAIRQRDFLLGKKITVELGEEIIFGEAVGISDRGYLLVSLDGEVRSFTSGHIKWN